MKYSLLETKQRRKTPGSVESFLIFDRSEAAAASKTSANLRTSVNSSRVPDIQLDFFYVH